MNKAPVPCSIALKVSAKQCVEKYQSNEEDPAVSAVDLPWCWYLAKPIWLECFLWALVKGCGQLYWLWHCSVLRSDIVVQCLVPLCHWQRSVRSNISFAAYSSTPTYFSTGGIVTAKQCPPRWLDLGVLCPLENCAYLAGCSKRTDALEDCIVIFSKIVDSSFRTALAHFPPPSLAWTSVEARFKKGHRKGESYNFASSFWRVSEFYYGTSRVSYIFQKYPKDNLWGVHGERVGPQRLGFCDLRSWAGSRILSTGTSPINLTIAPHTEEITKCTRSWNATSSTKLKISAAGCALLYWFSPSVDNSIFPHLSHLSFWHDPSLQFFIKVRGCSWPA